MLFMPDDNALETTLNSSPAADAPEKYDASKIDKLEGLEAVRKRPGMYIGDPDERGLHHCVFEVLDNSIDEHLAGLLRQDRGDHPRGRLVLDPRRRARHPGGHAPEVEDAGGRAGADEPARGRQVRPGRLQVLGRPARRRAPSASTRFPSGSRSRCRATARSITWSLRAARPREKLEVIGKSKHTGTLITFKPDPKIFTLTTEFKFEHPGQPRCASWPSSIPGVEIILTDERVENEAERFFYRDGIEEFVKQLGKSKQVIHPKPICPRNAKAEKRGGCFVDCVLQYNDSYNDQILCFANSISNPDGGTHLTGFRTALTRAINQYARQNELLKEKDPADHRRRRPRRPGLRPQRQAAQPALRVPDQGQARQHRDRRHRLLDRLRRPDDLFRRQPVGGQDGSSRRA